MLGGVSQANGAGQTLLQNVTNSIIELIPVLAQLIIPQLPQPNGGGGVGNNAYPGAEHVIQNFINIWYDRGFVHGKLLFWHATFLITQGIYLKAPNGS